MAQVVYRVRYHHGRIFIAAGEAAADFPQSVTHRRKKYIEEIEEKFSGVKRVPEISWQRLCEEGERECREGERVEREGRKEEKKGLKK